MTGVIGELSSRAGLWPASHDRHPQRKDSRSKPRVETEAAVMERLKKDYPLYRLTRKIGEAGTRLISPWEDV